MEITTQGRIVHRKDLDPTTVRELRSRCTAVGVVDPFTQVPPRICCLRSLPDGRLASPLHVPLDSLRLPEATDVRPQPEPLSDFPAFEGRLDISRRQQEAFDAVLKALSEKGAGVLSIPVGFGKTTVAIAIACHFKVKTLIVVHKTALLDQWVERIQTFAPGARIGRIQGPLVDCEDKHFVVGMLQSLSTKAYDRKVLDSFHLVTLDECHHVGAPIFSKAFDRLCVRYSLGLSATPERKDGLKDVISWYLGEVCFKVERKDASTVVVERMKYESPTYSREIPTFPNGQPALYRMIETLCSDQRRNSLLVEKASSITRDKSVSLLILSERRAHCAELKEALCKLHISAGLFLGGCKKEELEAVAQECQVILATYSMAAEGLDISRLNALILATPKGDVRQSVGRIMRSTGATALIWPINILKIKPKQRVPTAALPHRSTGIRLKEEQWVYAIKCNSRFYRSTHLMDSISMSSVVVFQKQCVAERMLNDLRYITDIRGVDCRPTQLIMQTSVHATHVNAPLPEGAILEIYPTMVGIIAEYPHSNCLDLDIITGDADVEGTSKIEDFRRGENTFRLAPYSHTFEATVLGPKKPAMKAKRYLTRRKTGKVTQVCSVSRVNELAE
ncbi:hypothetical protein KFL_008480030 [Klebsormidium nitens]|uniref:Helicase ATP-binding domain-containing protein n=1 Tax=Klebsormidium nitens TaxID=105231 RepID=A0A1Y1INU9_KLENI|nr:hypothetical protein KFL_008480030 [Klebsormidium nitens]|eukprot:GAQ91762.1 hypothetical protein KFL_008480030 [Klebsormidium nitens]